MFCRQCSPSWWSPGKSVAAVSTCQEVGPAPSPFRRDQPRYRGGALRRRGLLPGEPIPRQGGSEARRNETTSAGQAGRLSPSLEVSVAGHRLRKKALATVFRIDPGNPLDGPCPQCFPEKSGSSTGSDGETPRSNGRTVSRGCSPDPRVDSTYWNATNGTLDHCVGTE